MRRNIYWIKPFIRLVCLLIMSADETVPKLRIWPRSDASRALVKFDDNLSAKDIISRHTRNQNRVYLFDNPLIFRSRVDSRFCWPFVLSGAAFEISFLMSLSLDSTKRVRFLPCKVLTIKGRNSYVVLFPLTLFLFNGNSRRTNIEITLGLLRDTDRWFCATWRKIASETARKMMGGCVKMFKHVFKTIF